MIVVENTLISELIAERKFVCDLSRCKGECCVAGDAGAPLEEAEAILLEEHYPHYKEYLTEQGIKTISKHGFFELDADNDYLTPIVREEKYCAFVYFDGEIAKCAIEKAHNEGRINFRKPISCHLYPIRITSFKDVDALNYHDWDVCQSACEHGKKLDVPVYKFLKEPLIRKYGKGWYKELEEEINKY
ncbi:MAG: DUF3109 family protein [Bacteroidales bacterium]|jgi:hypothetical protein